MPKKLPPGIEWDESRGKFRASVYESGKRYRLGRFDTLIDAKAALAIARADVARGIFVPPSVRRAEAKREAEEQARAQTTVAEVAEDWLTDFEKQVESGQRKPATLREYRSVLSVHVLPRIGGMPVREVASRDVQRVADRAASARTRAKIVACMRRLFNYAVEREIIAASPVRVSAPKIKGSSLDVGKIASPHQVAALAAAMPGPLRLSVLLAAWCSLRQGEALGLQRRDIIGLESGSPRLRIERQWNQKAVPPGYTTPKSGAAREVTIPTALVPVIRDHLDIYVADDKDAPVFPSPIEPGKPISQTNHNKAWAAARVVAGLPSFRFHDLRHTGLTLYAQQGATLAEIMERGGHSDVEVVMRYQHAAEDRARRLADSLPVEL